LKSASGRLEAIYRSEGEKDLEILGFPCNQFRGQEPGTDEEIQDFCSTTYDVTFPVLAKVDVNGEAATPLYDYLWPEAPGDWGPQYGEFYAAINEINPPADPADVKCGTSPSSWSTGKVAWSSASSRRSRPVSSSQRWPPTSDQG
jgi:glutathione peroxidase-family protein